MTSFTPNPALDLVIERTVAVPTERVWAAWTQPDVLMQWFTPVPWKTVACEIDLRAGGRFNTTMESPEGEQYPSEGCYLEVVPERVLVFTSVMAEGFRPLVAGEGDLPFTGRIELTPTADGGTHYRAIAIHADESGCTQHREMGFEEGWNAALDQLVALMS